jgi:peptidoglycan/LPS O-acetylase OafA/YrhL
MTVLAVGTCLLIALAAETGWRCSKVLAPLQWLGQRSYEIYLSHMFLVIALFGLFVKCGESLKGVPILFIAVIVSAGVIGELVARFYSEPMNRMLRSRFGGGARQLGSVVDANGVAAAPLAIDGAG